MSDFAHITQLRPQGFGLNQIAVHAAQPDGLAALALQKAHKALAELARQHHLHDVGGFLVGHPQTIHKLALLADPLEHLADFRPAAMYQHHLHADQAQQHQVAHDGLFQFFVHHGVAAVFHHQNFTGVFLNVGQGVNQYLRPLCIA